ncbi:30S ribosomal protein S9 [Anaerohalosphaera lusitana]|uniref:Small ribosomal subunit protein uS9 n=1 Tax=Anaerohalosphaera lusitana TaxID=1936003 RepID=A0A1U9NHR1_9BACT|nr:30S ribosomal protein S9 [Anaerohalosphaera lusitana]
MAENTNGSPLIDPAIVAENLGLDKKEATEEKKQKKTGPDQGGFYWGTGRRKSSVARVRVKPGSGKLEINGKELIEYFRLKKDQELVLAPLQAAKGEKSFDVFVNVKGGGTTGQSGAVRLGIARALATYDDGLLPVLRDGGHLTRDSRMVERKKPGQVGARRSFQFSKR